MKSMKVLLWSALALGCFQAQARSQSSEAAVETRKEEARRVGEIQDQDVRHLQNRIKARRYNSFGFGPSTSPLIGGDKILYGFSLGKNWENNANSELRVTAHAATNADGQYFSAMLGLDVMPITGDISPVLGAEVGGAYAHYSKNDEAKHRFGYAGGVFAGARFFRTSDTQLELVANYQAVLERDTPNVYGVQIRMLF